MHSEIVLNSANESSLLDDCLLFTGRQTNWEGPAGRFSYPSSSLRYSQMRSETLPPLRYFFCIYILDVIQNNVMYDWIIILIYITINFINSKPIVCLELFLNIVLIFIGSFKSEFQNDYVRFDKRKPGVDMEWELEEEC